MSQTIGLLLPQSKQNSSVPFDTGSSAIESWVADLPRASIGACAKVIFETLKNINRQAIGYNERARFLEAACEPVYYVSHAMVKHYTSIPFPLPDKSKKIASIHHEILLKMAEGYSLAIEDLLTTKSLLLDKRKLTQFIHRAMTFYGQVLLTCYRIYGAVPDGVWLNINKLYAYAENKKIHELPVADVHLQHISKTTIANEFARILLLSLSSPYHLYQGEIDHLFVNLERWINLVNLKANAASEKNMAQFLVFLQTDSSPVHVDLAPDEIDVYIAKGAARFLTTNVLIDVLTKELQKDEGVISNTLIRTQRPDAALSHDFLRRLKISWSVLGKRVYSRKDRNSKLDIIIGLSATHKAMLRQVYDEDGHIDSHNSDDSQLIRMVDAQSKYQAKTIKSETDANPDVWEMVYDTGGRIRMTPDNILSVPSSTPIKSENTKVYCTDDNWMLINESAGGYCMQCDTSCGSNIRVGEIIGITTDDTNKDEWSLGILRWMRTYGDTGVKVGGQFIGKGVIPVAVSIAYDNSGNNNSVSLQRALLVPAIRAIGKSSSIITHTSRYRIGHIVNMHLKLKIVQIKLTRENILSGLYSEFEYEQVNKTLITHDEFDSQDVSSKNVDFKDVWSNF